ncbi:hypothetical protein J0H33_10645 [bacterium]|jgi:hypothetical protein|nr:hypothetical protein [bacterium]
MVTLRARFVLDDCRRALEMLEDEEDEHRWRVLWVAAVVLLRTVGDVLHKVDSRGNPRLAVQAATAFDRWKQRAYGDDIFQDFIKKERDKVVHLYELNVYDSDTIAVAADSGSADLLGGNLYRPIVDGVWEGEDARDVLQAAIDWWDRELAVIEDQVLRH